MNRNWGEEGLAFWRLGSPRACVGISKHLCATSSQEKVGMKEQEKAKLTFTANVPFSTTHFHKTLIQHQSVLIT
jgi:hypothetical protein